jgi:hypothetical protein
LLNELLELSRSLRAHGVEAESWHPWIKSFKKGDALVGRIDHRGALVHVSVIVAEEVARLRNVSPDNQKSFPGFNLDCPLLEATRLSNKASEVGLPSEISLDWPLAYDAHQFQRLKLLLTIFPAEVASKLRSTDGEILRATRSLLERMTRSPVEPQAFVRQLAQATLVAVKEGRVPAALAGAVLYGKPRKTGNEFEDWKATLILDVSDLDNFPYAVADPAVAIPLSAALFSSDRLPGTGGDPAPITCALTGSSDQPFMGKFPEPTLPYLGKTYLMSMNTDVPCQTRYGHSGSAIFSAGQRSVQESLDAIQFITRQELRGRTWSAVPNGSSDRNDLLISYLEDEPAAEIPLADFFSDSDSDAHFATFAERTQELHSALRVRASVKADSFIRVFALSLIDPGRKQVLFSGRYSVSTIYQARDNWVAGTHNAPEVSIPLRTGKGNPVAWVAAVAPSPVEALQSFKRQWLRHGQNSQTLPGVDTGRIYALLLEPDTRELAKWLLVVYLPRTMPLMLGLGRLLFGRSPLPEAARKAGLIAIALYGVLLFRQGRSKEIYMENRDYLLGQFLQFADRLHKLYCEHERKGSVPPQLIGNAAVSMTTQSPSRALQMLSHRMPVYLAWADRYAGANAGLVKWTRKELGRLSAALKDTDLSPAVTANGKAELLLGYLANPSTKIREETESR